jgi:hypothetical protein
MAKEVTYPKDHKPGMAVTKPGSSCANCRYLRPNLYCANEYFQKWNGGNKIPTKDANSYCSDWWEPREGRKTLGEQLSEQKESK